VGTGAAAALALFATAGACTRRATLAGPPAGGPVEAAIASASGPPAPPAPLPGAAGPDRPGPLARHVIIISEDGLRPDALLKANGSVHGSVMRQGAYSLTARTIRHASTLPSHAAMLSGFDEPAHQLSWNGWKPQRGYIQVPTVFDAAEGAGQGAAAFVGKQKLEHIVRPGSVDRFSRPGFFCKKVVEEAAQYFVEKKPALEFIHFSDPDERGHAIGWMSDPQIEAIRHTDRCLATLVKAVHDAGLDDVTLFILSADHGGHGRNHSGRTEEDRLIPWIAWGVGVRPGYHITVAISTMDTAATALWALGYPAPAHMEGRPVREAFQAR
jgi:predicted AlkP superfamily pyrophosphatase or phosphodiesterase